ncbi:MAG: helical backbone metal receptor [Bdellovibrionota bacterium]
MGVGTTATYRSATYLLVGIGVHAVLCVSLYGAPLRLATTSPDSTQLLADLDLGPQIVATVQPEVLAEPYRSLPSLGSLYLPNIEKLLSANVDTVVVDKSLHQVLFQSAIERLRIPYVNLHITSLESLLHDAERIARTLGGKLPESLRTCATSLQTRRELPRYTFLLLAWTNPAMAFGKKTLLSDILHAFGGENLVPNKWNQSYPQLSVEWLLHHRPDYVFVVTYTESDIERAQADIAKWWPQSDTKLIALPANHFSHANFSPLKHLRQLKLPQIPKGECP